MTAQNVDRPQESEDRLLILDDRFPRLSSPFRIAEYNAYLEAFPNAEVHSTGAFGARETRSFEEVRDEYAALYPQLKSRVIKFDPSKRCQARLAYTVFLNNAYLFLETLEKNEVPFVFTLYPGGGFQLNEAVSDGKLRSVCSSPGFRKVIVNANIARDYLIEGGFCAREDVVYTTRDPLLSERLTRRTVAKRRYQEHKGTFDVCFVAYKYMRRGLDKGYDVFVKTAKLLAKTHPDVFFHVVGPWDASDIDVEELRGRIRFYGSRHTDFFPDFYAGMDAILSPNIPFMLGPGAFDGFPTGCCIEAGLCGVAVFCTDHLGQNIDFRDGEEIVLISRDVEEIAQIIARCRHDYDDLCRLARKGQEAFRRHYDLRKAMAPRLQALSAHMAARPADVMNGKG
jgi:glycosyltransferase involved in cell wall biosynthesis